MPPDWLTVLAWVSLATAFFCAAGIACDIFLGGHRQPMGVMEAVWPLTALYAGLAGVLAYRAWGRPKSREGSAARGEEPEPPFWASVVVGVSHCGAGCTLGDVIAEFVIFGLGITIASVALIPEYIGDYVAAVSFGIVFQYLAIVPMRGLGFKKGVVVAAKADILSLTGFEVGLFGWMALMTLVLFPEPRLGPSSPVYWFLMQIGMVIGFATAYPVNAWLIRKGVKEAM